MIYWDFESILVPKNNGKWQNLNDFCTNKYQKYSACSIVYVDDNFSKLFKSYVGVYNFISSMIKETKHCSDILTKNLWWLKKI